MWDVLLTSLPSPADVAMMALAGMATVLAASFYSAKRIREAKKVAYRNGFDEGVRKSLDAKAREMTGRVAIDLDAEGNVLMIVTPKGLSARTLFARFAPEVAQHLGHSLIREATTTRSMGEKKKAGK